MNKQHLTQLAKAINSKTLAKTEVICTIALLILSVFFAVSYTSVKAANASALHTSGNLILDQNNNPVTLRGVGIAGMAPDLILWGNGASDSWGCQWQSASSTAVTDTFQP